MPFCHQSSFTKTSVLKERPFNKDFRCFADTVFFRSLYADGGTFTRVPRYISIYDEYGLSSTMNKKIYHEMCRAFNWKPSFKHYLNMMIYTKMKCFRYCKLKFLIYSRRKPNKYALTRNHFTQLTEKF